MKIDSKKTRLPQGGRLGRLGKIIAEKYSIERAENLLQGFEKFENSSNYSVKAAWIERLMQRMKNELGKNSAEEIMKDCGAMCCGVKTRKKAKILYQESSTLEEFLKKLNKQGIGGGRLKLNKSHQITGGYDKCYCGEVKQTSEPFSDFTYCTCSTGWYEQLFYSSLGHKVDVKLLQSILCGSKSCEFIIAL